MKLHVTAAQRGRCCTDGADVGCVAAIVVPVRNVATLYERRRCRTRGAGRRVRVICFGGDPIAVARLCKNRTARYSPGQ